MQKIKLSKFKNLAMTLANTVEDKREMLKNDLTDDFFKELEIMIKRGEIIIIQINGKMRLGKSTVAFVIGEHIFKLLQKHGFRSKKEIFGVSNVARDQHEKLNYLLNPNNKHNVIVTDEFNEMEDSGLNSTANQRLLNDFSNIQAGRYLHSINVSPTGVLDNNTDLIINVIDKVFEDKTCIAELKYREYNMGSFVEILVGTIRVPVGHLIDTWESKVKKHYDKSEWTKQDKEIIKKHVKSDWYTKYVIRKFQKMDIVNKEGVMRPRELQWVELQWDMIKKFKNLTKFTSMNTGSIKTMSKTFLQQKKIPVSILGIRELSDEVMGVLKLYEDYYKAIKKRNATLIKLDNAKNIDFAQAFQEQVDGLNEYIKEMITIIKENEKNFEDKIKLKKRYEGVDQEWE